MMTLAIATVTAIGERLRSHRSLARLMGRAASLFLVAFGIKLGTP